MVARNAKPDEPARRRELAGTPEAVALNPSILLLRLGGIPIGAVRRI